MAKPSITVIDQGEYRLVKFEIPGGVTTPPEFAEAKPTIPVPAWDKRM